MSSPLRIKSIAMTSTRGDISRNLNICLIVFSSIFVGLRFYVRGFMTKALGLDDAFSFIALVSLLKYLSSLNVSTELRIQPILLAQASLEIRGEPCVDTHRMINIKITVLNQQRSIMVLGSKYRTFLQMNSQSFLRWVFMFLKYVETNSISSFCQLCSFYISLERDSFDFPSLPSSPD